MFRPQEIDLFCRQAIQIELEEFVVRVTGRMQSADVLSSPMNSEQEVSDLERQRRVRSCSRHSDPPQTEFRPLRGKLPQFPIERPMEPSVLTDFLGLTPA